MPVAAALLAGGTALAKYGLSRYNIKKRGKFAGTPEGIELARRKREGNLTPEMEREILAQQNRTLSAQSEAETARTKGRLIKSGMGDSISGIRALSQPNTRRMAELGYTSRNIAASEAQAMSEAKSQFAGGQSRFNEETRQLKSQATGELIGGLSGALGGYLQSKLSTKQSALDFSRQKELAEIKSLTPEERIMRDIQAESAGGGAPLTELTGKGYTPSSYRNSADLIGQGMDIGAILGRVQNSANPNKDDVFRLQELLQSEGLYSGAIDGIMGPGTQLGIDQLAARNKYRAR